jgi:hypothetical protein
MALLLGHAADFAKDACVPVILHTTRLVVMESKPGDPTTMHLNKEDSAPAPSLRIGTSGPVYGSRVEEADACTIFVDAAKVALEAIHP